MAAILQNARFVVTIDSKRGIIEDDATAIEDDITVDFGDSSAVKEENLVPASS